MNRYNIYYGQYPTEREMDDIQVRTEESIGKIVGDIREYDGVCDVDALPYENSPPDMNVKVPPTATYVLGKESAEGGTDNIDVIHRVGWGSTETIDCSVDKDSVATVPTVSKRYISVMAKFARSLSDDRTDLDSNPIKYKWAESFTIEVWSGVENPSPVKPTVGAGYVLLFDVLLVVGTTDISNPTDPYNPVEDEIDYTRVKYLASHEIGNSRGQWRTLQERIETANRVPNLLINGDFDIWQRSVSTAVAAGVSTYVADRWRVLGATQIVTTTQEDFTLGQTAVPHEPKHFIKMVPAASTVMYITQHIRSVRTAAGKLVEGSFWVRSEHASTTLKVKLRQHFGTGGAPSGDTDTVIKSSIPTTLGWTKVTFSGTMLSVSGKTLGTNDNDYIDVRIETEAATSYYIEFAQMQFNEGNLMDFSKKPLAEELLDCMAYYELSYEKGTYPTETGKKGFEARKAAGSIGESVHFMVRKRATPTVVVYNPVSGNTAEVQDVEAPAGRAATLSEQCDVGYKVVAAVTDNNTGHWHWTADAEL